MLLLTTPEQISKTLFDLMRDYEKYSWCVAWAGVGFEPFEQLKRNKNKIKKIIVGLHFYQTHPDFIAEFIDVKAVRFNPETAELFHPKLYYFERANDEWALLIGSANFTKSANESNTEVMLMLSSNENSDHALKQSLLDFVDLSWNNARNFDHLNLHKYRNIYDSNAHHRHSLEKPLDFELNRPKDLVSSQPKRGELQNWSWSEYISKVYAMGEDAVLERLVLLETVRDIFSNTDHFEDLSLNDRKKICGLVKFQDGINWELFGHLKTNRISFVSFDEKKQIISQGLDAIPLSGDINGQYYTSFIDKFKDFSVTKQVLIASRLLTMKRPDYFVTRTKTNSPELNKHLLNSINEGESDYHQYYNKIICQIHESDWWSSSKPTDDLELRIWNCRTAMLDLIFYRKPE